jgi:hypothetical protein
MRCSLKHKVHMYEINKMLEAQIKAGFIVTLKDSLGLKHDTIYFIFLSLGLKLWQEIQKYLVFCSISKTTWQILMKFGNGGRGAKHDTNFTLILTGPINGYFTRSWNWAWIPQNCSAYVRVMCKCDFQDRAGWYCHYTLNYCFSRTQFKSHPKHHLSFQVFHGISTKIVQPEGSVTL